MRYKRRPFGKCAPPDKEFWIETSKSLAEVCRALAPKVRLISDDMGIPCYEFLKGEDEFGRTWRVCEYGYSFKPEAERMRIIIHPVPKNPEKEARELCDLLEERVYFGDVKHLDEDIYSFSYDILADYEEAG